MYIDELSLKLGSKDKLSTVTLTNPSCTIFVGPNNSGKSLVLREIARLCDFGRTSDRLIVEDITFRPHTEKEAHEILKSLTLIPRYGEVIFEHHVKIRRGNSSEQVHIENFLEALQEPNSEIGRSRYANYYGVNFLLVLDGPSRISLVAPQERGDLKNPSGTFARILTNDARRSVIRNILHDAFGLYLGIDMSEGSLLSLRYGTTPPPSERSVQDETLEWMRRAQPIENMSDGVKAFTGILLELLAGDPRVIVIDEPEAFLHPALAFKLGKHIAKTAVEADKHVFVSTHSPQFLMGAIQSGAKADVVRLTYQDGTATARILENSAVRSMMRDPLLRSANALAGVFYEYVVVTEADSDRAFYQEINERMIEHSENRGASNTLFLNANGKDSIHRLVGPLRKLGIPTAAIMDIDALNPQTNFGLQLEACGYPKPFDQVRQQCGATWRALTSAASNPKSAGGIRLLSSTELEKAENLLDVLDRYGLFIVRIGEVEHWLPNLQVTRNKKWLHHIFEALGSDPSSSEYVRPAEDDVWAFLDKITAWLKDKNRRGMADPTPNA